jgi:death-on-curing family protein
MSEVEIYQTSDNQTQVEVRFDSDTVWLTQIQLTELFQSSKGNISEHVKHLFEEGELIKDETVRKFRTVQIEGKKSVSREIDHYNLDVIISVGYRINSKRGTQFRQWATQRLKDHLVKGYTVNQKRLEQLQQTIQLIEQGGKAENLSISEAKGLLEIISNYTQSFVLLNQFDSNNLSVERLDEKITYEIKYKEAVAAIVELKKQLIKKKEASELFGREKDDSFAGILGSIVQTFDGQYLYRSIEEQAAHLLYFVIKNHPFNDGNKRIGAFLFVWFLEKNQHRFKKSGELKINDNALVALALLVAQSNPADKEIMVKLIINLVNG